MLCLLSMLLKCMLSIQQCTKHKQAAVYQQTPLTNFAASERSDDKCVIANIFLISIACDTQ